MLIFYAGVESMTRILEENKVENALATFYYLRNKSQRKVERILNSFPRVFLDSGAFSFREYMRKERVSAKEIEHELEQYIKQYVEFVRDWGDRFFVVAEVDVGDMYQKTKYREKLLQAGVKNLLPVIHRRDTRAYVEYLCKKYPYVGLGSIPDASYNYLCRYVSTRMRIAAKYGTKVHGFAITNIEVIKRYPFFSVDSTTWVGGSKYGMSFFFDGHKLNSYDNYHKFHRVRWKRHVMAEGIDWDEYITDTSRAVNEFNLRQWKKFEEWIKSPDGLGRYKEKTEYFRYRPHRQEPYEDRGIKYIWEDESNV